MEDIKETIQRNTEAAEELEQEITEALEAETVTDGSEAAGLSVTREFTMSGTIDGEPGEDPDSEEPDDVEEAITSDGGPAQEEAAGPEEQREVKKTRYGLPVDQPETEELAVRMEARHRYKEKKRRLFRTRFYVITASIIVIIAGLLFSVSDFFTIDSIKVQGNSHYTSEEIRNIGHAAPGHNILYKSGASEIKEYLEQNPYIKSAEVGRELPSTLVIMVTEREEKLAVKYDDDYLMMDGEGILLKKTRNDPMVTVVEGLVVSKIKLGEKIGTKDNRRFNKALDLINKMSDADLYFVKIDISDEKQVKANVYDTLTVKADLETLTANIENGRLHRVLDKLFEDGIKRGTITFDTDGSASFMPII